MSAWPSGPCLSVHLLHGQHSFRMYGMIWVIVLEVVRDHSFRMYGTVWMIFLEVVGDGDANLPITPQLRFPVLMCLCHHFCHGFETRKHQIRCG